MSRTRLRQVARLEQRALPYIEERRRYEERDVHPFARAPLSLRRISLH